jgi:hypothetical protein
MAISFIPNQPILFEDPLFAGQTCLNNDVRAYAQLAQSGDNTCIQWINEPILTQYSCDMTSNVDAVTNGGFDNDLTSWTEYDFATGTNLGTPTNWIWTQNGATSNSTATKIGLFQTIPGTVGNVYLISFDFTYDNNGDFKIGFGDAAGNNWVWVNLLNNFETNIDGKRCLLVSSYINLDFAFYCSTSDVTIKNIVIREVTTPCVGYDIVINSHWSYVESVNGWQKIDGTAATAFPLALYNSLANTDYRLTYKVMNMHEDGIAYFEIQDNTSASISKTYTNGEFVEYFNFTGTNPSNILANPEAQNGIMYDIKFEEMSYDYTVRISNTDGSCVSIDYNPTSLSYPILFWKDRIIWCFDWNALDTCDAPGNITNGCYKVTISDNYNSIDYLSYTNVNYTLAAQPCSLMMVASCSGSGFGFYFNDTDPAAPTFTLRQRLRLLQFNPTYPAKTEDYLYSNGLMSRSFAQSGKVRLAWFDYVDEPTHDVIRIQLLCESLMIDTNYFYCVAEDYEPEWKQNGQYNLAQSRVALMAVAEPTLFNKSCQ